MDREKTWPIENAIGPRISRINHRETLDLDWVIRYSLSGLDGDRRDSEKPRYQH
jgi:hypothetical protein